MQSVGGQAVTSPVIDIAHRFDDGPAYARFMGRWSRAAGAVFLDWLSPPAGVRWLDVGCGTGILTELILDDCSPGAVFAVDPARAQIDYACRQPVAQRANFRVGDAQALPFADSTFEVVASALVLNFIPDRQQALSEMRRVASLGGMVAGYVWDFAAELSPSWPLRSTMSQIGVYVSPVPGAHDTGFAALNSMFGRAGFDAVDIRSIEVTVRFADFDDFWEAQTPSYSPIAKTIAAMSASERARLMRAVRSTLPVGAGGEIEYLARANAVKGRVPA